MELATLFILIVCLAIALGFEFVNGFHDTANAVATVIYTRSMKPTHAVIWSGFVNFLGVLFVLGAGAGVAFKIVGLLPTDLQVNAHGPLGIWAILSILIVAVLWNLATWYVGLPASSSHTLVGSIAGVGLTWAHLAGKEYNTEKLFDTLKGLALAPLLGFGLAATIFILFKVLSKRPEFFKEPPKGDTPPPWWIRLMLIGTCTGVSWFHGSNDGQKGIGLVMLILIALVPGQYTVNPAFDAAKIEKTLVLIESGRVVLAKPAFSGNKKAEEASERLEKIDHILEESTSLSALPHAEQETLRVEILKAASAIKKAAKDEDASAADKKVLADTEKGIKGAVEFVAIWVIVAVALALGIGTMVGWKRIVVTVGEKIGKAHLTYAQGAAAELTAMITIATADYMAAPVSTTHILSSGIAGTMAANKSGLQGKTVRNILIAWVLTLPVTIVLSGLLFWATAGRYIVK